MNDLNIESILSIPEETQMIEFKRLQGDKVVQKIVRTIVAMANTDGGVIFFGIDDPEKTTLKGLARVFGIEENIDLFDAVGREIQKIAPPIGSLWKPQKIVIASIDKTIAFLVIPKSGEVFHAIDGEVWIRQYKSNKKLSPQEIVKFSYAKGFEKADKELVQVDFNLLKTEYFEVWRVARNIGPEDTATILENVGLARRSETEVLLPTRAAVLLFAKYPTNLLDTKCTIRVFQYAGTIESLRNVPNMIGVPKTIDGPLIKVIKDAHDYVLLLLRSGIEIHSGFLTKYQIPERVIKEAITNAVIHRDYHIKRDIEVSIFEDRVEILSPGLLPYNITKSNIGYVRADGYRNDLVVKHLREFPEQPNLDKNEGVRAMRNEMQAHDLYDPIYVTYPVFEDSVKVVLLNEKKQTEWEKIQEFLMEHRYINNSEAREITGVTQIHVMSRLLKRWVTQGLLLKIETENKSPKFRKYKLSNADEFKQKI